MQFLTLVSERDIEEKSTSYMRIISGTFRKKIHLLGLESLKWILSKKINEINHSL